MDFLDVKTDYAFKKVFGSENSKNILKSFLNSILDLHIADLTIVDPYQIPLIKGMKDTYVDVKAVLENGETVIIEMQVLNVPGFEKRVLYNAAKSYSAQLVEGENYSILAPIIALTLTDFIMFDDVEDCFSTYKMQNIETSSKYSEDIQMHFIELPKFNKDLEDLETLFDKWIYFVKNAGSLEYKPESLKSVDEIDEAFRVVNKAALSKEELEAQFKRHDFIILQKGSIEKGYLDGIEKGRAEGHAEGIEQGLEQGIEQGLEQGIEQGLEQGIELGEKVGIAKTLIQYTDKSDQDIAQETGLTVEEVAALR